MPFMRVIAGRICLLVISMRSGTVVLWANRCDEISKACFCDGKP